MKIGIDIGGSHIGIGLLDEKNCIITETEKNFKTAEKKGNMKKVIENIILLGINEILLMNNIDINQIEVIGIAAPGIVTKDTIVRAENLNIKNFNIIETLSKQYQIRFKICNDAKSAIKAEQKYGAINGYDDAVFLCLGTGIGGAVIQNGIVLETKKGCGYELGHMIIEKNGKKCSCGKYGCFETYCSMLNLKNEIIRVLNLEPIITGEKVLNIVKESLENEEIKNVINNYIDYLSIGISNIINIFEPEIICLGGSFAYFEDILLEPLKTKIEKENLLYNSNSMPIIKKAYLGNKAGIIGSVL